MAREKEVNPGKVTFDIPEVGEGGIEPVVGDREKLKAAIELEAFMNEKIEVVFPPTSDVNLPKVPSFSVNSVDQPVPRGRRVWIKRKYVEVAARNKKEDYEQVERQNIDALPPMMNTKFMRGTSMLVDPFMVITDPNPKGDAWLERIMAETR